MAIHFQQNLPIAQLPFINPDGTVSRQWLYFLTSLWNRTGGSSGDMTQQINVVGVSPPAGLLQDEPDSETLIIPGPPGANGANGLPGSTIFEQNPEPEEPLFFDLKNRYAGNPISITAGATPYTYTSSMNGSIMVSGGALSNVQFIRNGTTVSLGSFRGAIPVQPGDSVVFTFTAGSPPTLALIPA